jgi:hypothetical protein
LAAAGSRALLREDYTAATNLLERAAALSPVDLDVALEEELVFTLFVAGRLDDASRRAARAGERAAAAGDRNAEASFKLAELVTMSYSDPEGANDALEALVLEALPRFQAAGNDLWLFNAYFALGQVGHNRLQGDRAADAFEEAVACAQRLGHPYREGYVKGWLAASLYLGSAPASEVIARLQHDDFDDEYSRAYLALARAMTGQIEEARVELAAARELHAERGMTLYLGARTLESADLERLADEQVAAVELGTEACRLLEELGERGWFSTAAADLGQALYALDRLDEAESWAWRSREAGASDDLATQAEWRQVQAKVLARRGDIAEAERLAGEAVEVTGGTQNLNRRADSLADLATVLDLAGKPAEARAALEQSLELYERKGNLVMADRIRARLG